MKQKETLGTWLASHIIEEAETKPDVRTDVLKNRLKMFTGKRINFYINGLCRKIFQLNYIKKYTK